MRRIQLVRFAATVSWLAASAGAMAQTPGAAAQALGADSVFERPLVKGAPDVFRVTLAAGQFLRAAVEQRALDVALRFVGPDGRAIVSSDTMNGSFGVERIALIAPSAGEYRIEVSTGATAPDGRYVLRVLAIRAATPSDLDHAAAERIYAEAETLRRPNTADARIAAVAKFQEAAAAFQRLGLKYETAMSLYSSGIQQLIGGQARGAESDLATALPIVRELNDPLLPSVVNALGGAYDNLGEPARAMASYREALAIFRANSNTVGAANALNNVGKVYADLTDWEQALDYYRQALPIWQSTRNTQREGITLNNIGFIYHHAGNTDRALEYFSQSLERRRAAGDKAGEADTLSAMARAEARRSDYRKALSHYESALPLRRAAGNRVAEAAMLSNIGRTHTDMGDPQGAMTFFEQALPLLHAGGDRRNEAIALADLASAYVALKRPADALDRAEQALAILREYGDRNMTAGALYVAARARRDLGKLTEAAASAAEALKTIEEVRGRVASRELRTTYYANQHDVAMFYVDVLMRLHDQQPAAGFDARALAASERARARSLIDLLAGAASSDFRRGADPALLERERQVSERLSVKSSRLVGLLARGARTPESDALAQEVRTLEGEFDDIQAALKKASPAYAAMTQPQPVDAAAIQRALTDARTTVLEYALGAEASYVWAIDRQRVRSYRLPPSPAIEQATRDAYGFVTARGTAVAGETAVARAARIAAADQALPAALDRLSRMILGPVLPLSADARLVIVADGALEYLPFAMLPVPGGARASEPLVARAEVISVPSASTLITQRALLAGRKPAAKGLAILADPVFDAADTRVTASPRPAPSASAEPAGDQSRLLQHLAVAAGSAQAVIPRLPFTAAEATAITTAVGGSATFAATGFEARKEAVLGDRLKDYKYVHFATHGFIDTENPSLSAIALSLVDREGRPQDGFLRADELYGLSLSADLVVLSACQTGLGKSIRGEGVVGLTRGLMYAGASKVIVSLWSVSDRATADLMARLYREMVGAGRTPAAALRAAQIAASRTPQARHPYYWAAFTLQGDWE